MVSVGDGGLSPNGFYFKIDALWQPGLDPLVIERFSKTKDTGYEPYLTQVGNLDYDLNRPGLQGDLHEFGAFC